MVQETRPTLLDRLRDPRDERAWAEFHERYGGLVAGYCRRRGLQACDAEDVSQIVLTGFHRALGAFRYDAARGRFRAYLGRAVERAIRRHVSGRHGGEIPLEAAVEESLRDPEPPRTDEQWEREWRLHHLRLAMRAVRACFEPRSVEIFERLRDGAGVAEVAGRYGVSEQAVHKVLQRIRDRLRERIGAQIADEEASRA